jgi:hypothetical protein
MRLLVMLVMCFVAPAIGVAGNLASDFDVALARWNSAAIQNYTFTYEDNGGGLITPICGGAQFKLTVRKGVGGTPVVIRGTKRCPVGTRVRAADLDIPVTIDEAFNAIKRYIRDPPTPVRVTVTYESQYGYPLTYSAEKLEISDSDEGFVIAHFSVLR